MKKLRLLFALTLVSVNTFASAPPFKASPDMPLPVQMVQWDLQMSDQLLIFKYINPMEADLHLKIVGPQGYVIHVENLSDASRNRIGFQMADLPSGEYTVVLESGEVKLESTEVSID